MSAVELDRPMTTADRELPGWAGRPDVGDHVVTCPTCGEVMSWAAFLEHGPDCDGED